MLLWLFQSVNESATKQKQKEVKKSPLSVQNDSSSQKRECLVTIPVATHFN